MVKCNATCANGKPCNANAMMDCELCSSHYRQKLRNQVEKSNDTTSAQETSKVVNNDIPEKTTSISTISSDSESVSMSHTPTASRSQSDTESTLNAVSARIGNLENIVEKLIDIKKPTTKKVSSSEPKAKNVRNMTDKGALVSAKWIYYQEHKTDPNLDFIQDRLSQVQLLAKKSKIVDNKIVEVSVIPWQLVKIATDMMWESESANVKETYINLAWGKHASKKISY
jgi:hypothetical protein